MKKIACLVLLAGCFISSYATDARVLTMGGNDNFFMDDMSIFRNPANINYYPNMILGSLGIYVPDASDTAQFSGMQRTSKDPQRPFGGVILSYSLNQSSESGNQYPLLSIGAILNRWDPMLNYFDQNSIDFKTALGDSARLLLDPVGKLDIMAGYALSNGAMIGIGTYLAFQKEKKDLKVKNTQYQDLFFESHIFKGNVGVNWPIAKSMNLEASVGITSVTGKGVIFTSDSTVTPETFAESDLSYRADLRLFSALVSLNGDFVPHISFEQINLKGYSVGNYSLGLGVNINIDKGFFWTGLEGIVEDKKYKKLNNMAYPLTLVGMGGKLSAGLERNVVWDWLVLRIGVSKKLLYVSDGSENGHWEQNVESNGSDGDFASVGVGVNIENRFRIDGVLAENIFYTFTNLISAPQHHLMNRITLTYSF